jgi:lipoate-protein ligase A
VLVTVDDPVWIDVWIPSVDPLWHADVERAFDWIGSAWASALGRTGIEGLSTHREGSVACTRWSKLVCFGGVGTGEVVTGDGRKIVGLAQRRNRHGAWFHGACVLRWDPAPLVDLLDLPEAERNEATADLAAAVAGVVDLVEAAGGTAPDASTVAAWLIAALP